MKHSVVLLQGYSKRAPPHSHHSQACTRAPDGDQAMPMPDQLMCLIYTSVLDATASIYKFDVFQLRNFYSSLL